MAYFISDDITPKVLNHVIYRFIYVSVVTSDFSASPTSVQFVSTTSFFLGQLPTVPLALLAEKRHSRLLRIAVRAGGFLFSGH